MKNRKFLNIEISKANAVLLSFIILSLVISLFPVHYGYFRDELYNIALSKHLAWGYVDVPPLLPLFIAIGHFFFGESLFALHIIPAICAVAILIVTREIVKKFGGKLFAQILALVCVTLAPIFVSVNSMTTYDCLDHLFWALCLYALVCLLTSANKKYWLYFGLFAGLGLMAKFGMLWLGFGVFLALFLTPERKYLATWQFWAGGLLALLIVSPYLIWIASHQFLTLEYFAKYSEATAPLSIWSFLREQIFTLNSVAFLVWLLGLYYFLFNREGRKFRLFAFTYLIIFAVCILQQAKFYTIIPLFPILFAGGAVYIEKITSQFRKLYFSGIFYTVLIAVTGLLFMPLARPVLPAEALIKYLNFTHHLYHGGQRAEAERLKLGVLPQQFADRFGWQGMTAEVAKIYYSLPKPARANTFIITQNYGEASAIYFYGRKYHLPMPISQHLQFYVWWYRNATDTSPMIAVGFQVDDLRHAFKQVKKAGQTYNKYAMPYENASIYLCKNLKQPIKRAWEQGKDMHM
jgi:hypothetical protein